MSSDNELDDTTTTPGPDGEILHLLSTMSYDLVARRTGWSRGRIYALALRHGARKTEARIAERKAERRQRQHDTLRELIGQTAQADVLDYLGSLPDASARMVLTSPPYNVGKPYGGGETDQMRHLYYLGWLYQIVSECARILQPGGTLCLQLGSTRDDAGTLMPIDMLLAEPARKAGLTL